MTSKELKQLEADLAYVQRVIGTVEQDSPEYYQAISNVIIYATQKSLQEVNGGLEKAQCLK